MSWFSNLFSRNNTSEQSEVAPEDEHVTEAAGTTLGSYSDDGFRRITGDAERDFDPIANRRMQDLAVYLWRSNPIVNRLIELPLAYILGEGVRVKCIDEEAQEWCDDFWDHPINCMDLKLTKKVRELAMYGEQCWPVFVSELEGKTQLGYLDPCDIKQVVMDPENAEQPIGVITNHDSKFKRKKYRVIVNGPETVFSKATQAARKTFTDGDCFYFKVNDLSNTSRGTSDILPVADLADQYLETLFNVLDRWGDQSSYLWHCIMHGATQEEINAKLKSISRPVGPTVRVTNEKEEWKAESPDMNASDTAEQAKLFKSEIIGGQTMPLHWFGDGGDANRATAGEMHEPTFKMFGMRQTILKHILTEVMTFVIRMRYQSIMGVELDFKIHSDYKPVIEFPEMTVKDTTKYASALQQVAAAVIILVDRGLIPEQEAVNLVAELAGRLGVEFDPEEALETAKAELEKTRQDELDASGFSMPADDMEEPQESEGDTGDE
jgi:hypothetical protein